ncbi:MAG: TetR/AcrR family transcriptional regulator [Anaerolineales bacterium]
MNPRPRSDEKVRTLLDAARTILGERGYAAATISEIAAEAGVSRGLLHYYFKSKEDLLAQVVRVNLESTLEMVILMFAQSETPEDLSAGLTGALRAIVAGDPAFFNLVFECWVVARQSPVVAREINDLFRQFRESVRDGLAGAAAQGVIAPALPLDGLAALLTGLIDGLALQLVIDSQLAANESIWETLERAIRVLLGDNA